MRLHVSEYSILKYLGKPGWSFSVSFVCVILLRTNLLVSQSLETFLGELGDDHVVFQKTLPLLSCLRTCHVATVSWAQGWGRRQKVPGVSLLCLISLSLELLALFSGESSLLPHTLPGGSRDSVNLHKAPWFCPGPSLGPPSELLLSRGSVGVILSPSLPVGLGAITSFALTSPDYLGKFCELYSY